jgi:hypothetical protein
VEFREGFLFKNEGGLKSSNHQTPQNPDDPGARPLMRSALGSTVVPPAAEFVVSRRVWVLITFAAIVSVCIYAVLEHVVSGLTLAEPTFAGEVIPWVRVVTKRSLVALADAGSHPGGALQFLILMAALFAIYAVALRVVGKVPHRAMERFVFTAGAAFLLLLLCAPVMLSTDVYAYAIYGRVFAIYGASPYAETAPITGADPFMPLFGIAYMSSWYGPLWTLICAGVARVGGDHVGLTALLFRGLSVTAVLGAAALLWSNLRRVAPERCAQGLVLFLWNPLVVLEIGLSGHNDSVMVSLVLLGAWLHLRGWKVAAVVALTLSVLVKFLTGPVAALYVWMVLRQMPSWRERFVFLARSGLAAATVAVAIAAAAGVRVGEDVPAAQSATSPDFYANNFHELIFKRLRLALGEDPDLVRQPIYFESWWARTTGATELKSAGSSDAPVACTLAPGAPLLTLARPMSEWLYVYDPTAKAKGYVNNGAVEEASPPAATKADPAVRLLATPPMERETVRQANNAIRLVTWSLFAAFGLLAAWRTVDLQSFLIWSAAAMLAAYFLIITEIWPWYIIWSLALGAMQPGTRPARFAIFLSAGVLTLYATIGYQGSEPAWIHATRSLPAFIAPLFLWLLSYAPGLLRSRTP